MPRHAHEDCSRRRGRPAGKAALCFALSIFGAMPESHADEDGISLWLPGTYGSLAATPLTPG